MATTFPPNDVLRSVRTRLGLTQRAMGQAIGCDSAWICSIERGHARMGAKTAQRIEKQYGDEMARMGITLSDLLRGRRGLPDESMPTGPDAAA